MYSLYFVHKLRFLNVHHIILFILDDFRFRPSIQLSTENPEFKAFYMPYMSTHYSLLYFNGYAIILLAFNLVMFKLKGWYNCVRLMFWRVKSAKLYYRLLSTLNIPLASSSFKPKTGKSNKKYILYSKQLVILMVWVYKELI